MKDVKPERTIKSYVSRSGRLTKGQEENYKKLYPVFGIDFQEDEKTIRKCMEQLELLSSKYEAVICEIGFGNGKVTAEIAENNPDKLYIAIDVYKPGVGALLGLISEKGLSNVRVIRYDAVLVLEKLFKPASIDGFHIFFPDPWPKKKHHKRRLIQAGFLDILYRKTKPEGYCYLATDWVPYSEFMLKEIEKSGKWRNTDNNGFADRQLWRPVSAFEKKGLKKNHEIREIILRK